MNGRTGAGAQTVKSLLDTPVTGQAGNPGSKTLITGQAEGTILTQAVKPALKAPVTGQKRKPIPAEVKHAVNLRDQGQCTFHFKGKRCEGKPFLHIHHRIPVSKSGKNTVENLITLCFRHHSLVYERGRE